MRVKNARVLRPDPRRHLPLHLLNLLPRLDQGLMKPRQLVRHLTLQNLPPRNLALLRFGDEQDLAPTDSGRNRNAAVNNFPSSFLLGHSE